MIVAALPTSTAALPPFTLPSADTEAADAEDAGYMPFSVSPASGEVAAGAAAEIHVKFSPLDVSEYFACLYAR